MTSHHVRIVSTGGYLPGEPLSNDDLERLCGPLPDDVLDGLQVRRRHWMIDPGTGEHLVSNSEMATAAARQALDRAGLEAADVDLLVMSTSSPEYPLPAAVTFVQERLGLARCAVVEVRSGCAGAMHALDIARRQLADGSARTAVVIGSEAVSPVLAPIFLGRRPDSVRLRDRIAIYNFGDGAGAMVLRAEPAGPGEPASFHASVNACMGGDRKPGMQIIGGGTHAPVAEQMRARRPVDLRLDVVESASFGPRVFVTALDELLRRSGLTLREVDACVVPEGNAGYFNGELEAAGLSAEDCELLAGRVVENLTDVGATGSAAVPLALDDAWTSGRIRPGDEVLLLAIETSRWLYAGLSLTWSAPWPGAGLSAADLSAVDLPAVDLSAVGLPVAGVNGQAGPR
ncbi:3-oxoacyl-[acyl-carrier-protein] synthase III C-terminal domain-containing protein [Frankia sp. CiP1_Cm_nod1]|uniref:3-oxoacyl-[acyl-carrier-protein] synthase III C-terminal domain-containing protein n=1 Tax=Frankia sp. CiP1_Cm_nod1 TaxID=2897160 RepID=UPI002025792F